MAEKKVKSRIVHKHDTAANWSKATSFVPLLGEIIIYDIDSNYNYERVKIGDGVTTVVNLPFIITDSAGSDYGIATTGDGAAYVAIVPGINALDRGVSFIMLPHVTSTSTAPTLNVNGFGAKPIRRRLSSIGTGTQSGYTASWIAKDVPFRVVYDGTSWITEGLTKPAAADLYGAVQIAKGGTGATDAATALANLGAVSIDEIERLVGETPVADQINDAIGTKADINHTHNAYVNQNAFSNITIGSTTIAADSTTDTLTLAAGSNITLTPDATNDKITIAATDTVYTHPTTSGNKHIPSGGSSGQILRWSDNGTAVWGEDNNTTYSVATKQNDGLMSSTDKASLENLNTLVGDESVASQISNAISDKADSNHTHDDRYYTETEINTKLAEKSDADHTHNYAASTHSHAISDVANLQTNLNAKVSTSRTVNGKALSSNITLTASDVKADPEGSASSALSSAKSYTDAEIAEWVGDKTVATQISTAIASKSDVDHTHTATQVGADPSGSAASALSSAKTYTDTKISSLINGAPTTLDTLGEIADAMNDNADVVEALEAAIGTKANASSLTEHTGNKSNPHGVTLSQLGVTATVAELNYVDGVTSNVQTQINNLSYLVGDESVASQINDAMATKSDLNHTHSNYVNQNAFSNIKVGSTTVAADTATDTLTLVAGSNVTLTPDATNDKITITATDTIYTHPTTTGNKHIPSGGKSGQILRWYSDGTAVWGEDNNTTYDAAISSLNALVGDTAVSAQITNAISGKADSGHTHDGRYYTESEIDNKLSAKSDADHTHNYAAATHVHVISDVTNLQDNLNAKVPTSRTVNGKSLSSNITLSASDVGADVSGSASSALTNAKAYTDAEIAEWVGDKTVSSQISTAIAAKSDIGHTHTAAQVGAATVFVTDAWAEYNAWSSSAPYTQTIAANGVLASDTPLVDFRSIGTDDLERLQSFYCVNRIVAGDGTLTLYAYEEKPVEGFGLTVMVVR